MLLPIEREHLKRLLTLAASAPGFEDLIDTYRVTDGTSSGVGPFAPLADETGIVRDTVFLNLGDIRVIALDPRGNEPTPESPCVRSCNVIFEMCIDGKWMRSLSLRRVELPAFDYASDDVVRVKAEFGAVPGVPCWAPA